MEPVKRSRIAIIFSLFFFATSLFNAYYVAAVPLQSGESTYVDHHQQQQRTQTDYHAANSNYHHATNNEQSKSFHGDRNERVNHEHEQIKNDNEASVKRVESSHETTQQMSNSEHNNDAKPDLKTTDTPESVDEGRRQLHNGVPSKPEMEREVGTEKLEEQQVKAATSERTVIPPLNTNTETKEQVADTPNLTKETSMRTIDHHQTEEKQTMSDKGDENKDSDKQPFSVSDRKEDAADTDRPDLVKESHVKKIDHSATRDEIKGEEKTNQFQWVSLDSNHHKEGNTETEKPDLNKEGSVRKIEEQDANPGHATDNDKESAPVDEASNQWVSLSKSKKEDDTVEDKPDLNNEHSVKKVEQQNESGPEEVTKQQRVSVENDKMGEVEASGETVDLQKGSSERKVIEQVKEKQQPLDSDKKEGQQVSENPSLEGNTVRTAEDAVKMQAELSPEQGSERKEPLSNEKREEDVGVKNADMATDSVKTSEQKEATVETPNVAADSVKTNEQNEAKVEAEGSGDPVVALDTNIKQGEEAKEASTGGDPNPEQVKLSSETENEHKATKTETQEDNTVTIPKTEVKAATGDQGAGDKIPTNARIINGESVKSRDEFPFVVDLSESDVAISSRRFCTGTLIDRTTVLTAAHCVINQGYRAPVYATVGRVELEDGHRDNLPSATLRTVASMVHPEYNGIGSPYDVAVLLLNKTCESSPPVALTTESADNGTRTWVVGYGIQTIGTLEETARPIKILAGRLQKSQLRIVPRGECDLPSIGLTTEEGLLCTKGMKLGASACMGDSGGGLFRLVDGDNNNHGNGKGIVQVGIVSYGDSHCASEESGVFTDVANVREWIRYASTRLHSLLHSSPVDLHMDDSDVGTELSHTDTLGGKLLDKYAHDLHAEQVAIHGQNHTGEHNVKHYTVTTNFSKKTDVHVSLCNSIKLKGARAILATTGAALSVRVDGRNKTMTNHGSCAQGKLSQVTIPGLEKDRFIVGISANASIPIRLTLSVKSQAKNM